MLTIPITTDPGFIDKISNFIEMKVKLSSLIQFSEKSDSLVMLSRLNFFSKMYLATIKHKVSYLFCLYEQDFTRLNVHFTNLPKEFTLNYSKFFSSKYALFYDNLRKVLADSHILLTKDKKFAKFYKDFKLFTSGNRISFSFNQLLKYSQLYLKVFAILINDPSFIAQSGSQEIQDLAAETDFSAIIELIFFLINHFFLKKLKTGDEGNITENIIYTENDISTDLATKLSYNLVLLNESLDTLVLLVKSPITIFSIVHS